MNNCIKIILYSCLITVSFGISSCKKFLEENPKSFLSPQNYYKNQSDALAALVGAYNGLGSNSSSFLARPVPYMTFYCSDEAYPPTLTNEKQLNNYSFTTDHSDVRNAWQDMYDAINRANIVINRVPDIPMDDAVKQQYIGEAKFLRGLEYFYGVRLWGALPLMTKEVSTVDEAYVSRSAVADVYKLIISDLEFASANLPAKNEDGRASKGAALGILAKVYLTRASSEAAEDGDYQKCAELCQEVINMPEHHLMADYQKVFGPPNEFNAESLFELQGDRVLLPLGLHSIFGSFTMPRGIKLFPEQGKSDGGSMVCTVAYFNLYDSSDYRRESTVVSEGVDFTGKHLTWQNFQVPFPAPCWKYVDRTATDRNQFEFGGNFIVLRLADVYLMRAEALNEINGPTPDAYATLNAIRARARNRDGITPSAFPADLIPGLSKDEFRDSVLYERAVELGFEGKRWFDLVRTKRLVQTIKAIHPDYPISDKNLLFPIPQQELILNNKLTQNPGW
jgi:hypothetical protein